MSWAHLPLCISTGGLDKKNICFFFLYMYTKWKMDPPGEINFSKMSKFWATLTDRIYHIISLETIDNNTWSVLVDEIVNHLRVEHIEQYRDENKDYFCGWTQCERNQHPFKSRYKLVNHLRSVQWHSQLTGLLQDKCSILHNAILVLSYLTDV